MAINEIVNKNIIAKFFERIVTKNLFWILTFSVLTAFSAQVSIPVQPVPFTLQTMFVLLSGAFLGARNAAYSQIIYLGLGIIGLPVFADLSFGVAKLFGPTGGYLLSFPLASYIAGYFIERKKNLVSTIISMVAANLLILLVGAGYLSTFYNGNIKHSFFVGALIFSIWDIIKISASVGIYYSFSRNYLKSFK